jgi:hypothetical protein
MKPSFLNRFRAKAWLFAVLLFCFFGSHQMAHAQNLILNGNFSSGNTNFTSSYPYNVLNSGPELVEGAYSVVTKASDVHFAWGNYFDRTSGNSSGRYFVANASADITKTVWQSNLLNVSQANTPYRFEAYLMSIYPYENNYPRLSFEIGNGTSWTTMGTTTTLNSSSRGNWIFTYVDGIFGGSGDFYVRLKNSNAASGGNDLGLDDIYFGLRTAAPSSGTTPGVSFGSLTTFTPSAVPEPSALSLLVVGLGGLVMMRRIAGK